MFIPPFGPHPGCVKGCAPMTWNAVYLVLVIVAIVAAIRLGS